MSDTNKKEKSSPSGKFRFIPISKHNDSYIQEYIIRLLKGDLQDDSYSLFLEKLPCQCLVSLIIDYLEIPSKRLFSSSSVESSKAIYEPETVNLGHVDIDWVWFFVSLNTYFLDKGYPVHKNPDYQAACLDTFKITKIPSDDPIYMHIKQNLDNNIVPECICPQDSVELKDLLKLPQPADQCSLKKEKTNKQPDKRRSQQKTQEKPQVSKKATGERASPEQNLTSNSAQTEPSIGESTSYTSVQEEEKTKTPRKQKETLPTNDTNNENRMCEFNTDTNILDLKKFDACSMEELMGNEEFLQLYYKEGIRKMCPTNLQMRLNNLNLNELKNVGHLTPSRNLGWYLNIEAKSPEIDKIIYMFGDLFYKLGYAEGTRTQQKLSKTSKIDELIPLLESSISTSNDIINTFRSNQLSLRETAMHNKLDNIISTTTESAKTLDNMSKVVGIQGTSNKPQVNKAPIMPSVKNSQLLSNATVSPAFYGINPPFQLHQQSLYNQPIPMAQPANIVVPQRKAKNKMLVFK